MREDFKNANYWWILLSLIVGAFSHLIRSLRWNILIKAAGYKPKPATTFYAVMVGYLANMAIPRIGEITRCGVLSRTKKMPMGMLIGTVISERIFDLITLLFLIVLTVALQFDRLNGFLDQYIFAPLGADIENPTISVLITIALIVGVVLLFIVALKYVLVPIIKHTKFFYRFKRILINFRLGIRTILKNDQKWLFFAYTVLLWFAYTLMLWLCVFALDETSHLSLVDGLTIMIIGSLGIVAPVPGGIGAYHFIVIALLTEIYLIADAAATSFAYIAHTSQVALIIVVGTLSYVLLIFIQRKSKTEKT